MQDLDEDETIQSLVQLKDLRSFEQQASGAKIEDKQREKEEEDGETSKTYVPEALAPSSTESISALAGAAPLNEEEEIRPPRSIAAITNEEKLKRAERRKAEGKGRKYDQEESDSDFEMNESEDPEEEEEEEEESEDASDDEYSEGERSRRRSSRESGAGRRREHYDKETLFYVNGTLRERNFSDGGNASPSPSPLHAPGSAGANGHMATMLDKSAASKRKYNRFNRRNLSFDDRCQQLVEFKHTYGHCHVKRTHPGETKGLAYWVERQRMAWRKGTLELDKKKRLDDIGFVWEAGTNGSGSDDLREYEALHASNRIKAELAESQSNLLAEPPGDGDSGHCEGSESAAQRDPAEGDAAGDRRESTERSGVTGEALVPREESRERSRDDTVTRRGRLKLEEAKSFDDWCALLQQFKDKHGHCDVKRRYFGKNKGLAYWAERQRASRRKGSLEEEKINKLDSMGFVWGNNDGTATPRKSSNGNDSMDYSFDASVDGEMEETASPMEVAANDVVTTSTTTSITITPPPSARLGVPRAVASALEDLDCGRQPHHQDSKKALSSEWERVHRKDREQLELLKRKLEEEERRARNREKKIREEKREWEEESINLQLENCLLKEKLLTLDEELRANSQGITTVSAFSAKRKRHEPELVGQDLADETDAAEKRRKTTEPSAHEGGDAAAAGGQKALLPALPAPAHVSADKPPASSSSTEPTDLWALLCALEGHLRSLVHDQKAIATHQRVLLDMASTVVATSAANVTTAADVDTAADSLSVSTYTGGSEAEPVELAVAAPTAESSASTPAEMVAVEGEGEGPAAPILDETDKEPVKETALMATSEVPMETAGPEQAVEPTPQQGENESVAASELPPVLQEEPSEEEDPQPS